MAKREFSNAAISAKLTKINTHVNRFLSGPRCNAQENAELISAALIALRRIANEARHAGEETTAGKWRRGFDALLEKNTTRVEFIEELVIHTSILDSASTQDMASLCVLDAAKCALSATHAEFPREFRLTGLLDAGLATGALAVLENPGELETKFKKAQTQRLTDARHKDNRADRDHVWRWLEEHRNEYKTDVERRDAIVGSKQVSLKSSTIGRLITEWNSEQRNKQPAI